MQWRSVLRLYAPGAVALLALVASCDLLEGACLDYENWDFRNATGQVVDVTPLYTGVDGAEHVVPRHGWQQTEFRLQPGERRLINLETGDFPFHRVLVETTGSAPWTMPVATRAISVVSTGPSGTPSQLAAKLEPTHRRLKLYSATAAAPLLWTLPIVGVIRLRRRRSVARQATPG